MFLVQLDITFIFFLKQNERKNIFRVDSLQKEYLYTSPLSQ